MKRNANKKLEVKTTNSVKQNLFLTKTFMFDQNKSCLAKKIKQKRIEVMQ